MQWMHLVNMYKCCVVSMCNAHPAIDQAELTHVTVVQFQSSIKARFVIMFVCGAVV